MAIAVVAVAAALGTAAGIAIDSVAAVVVEVDTPAGTAAVVNSVRSCYCCCSCTKKVVVVVAAEAAIPAAAAAAVVVVADSDCNSRCCYCYHRSRTDTAAAVGRRNCCCRIHLQDGYDGTMMAHYC